MKPDKTLILAVACVLCVIVILVLIGMYLAQKSQYDQAVQNNRSYSSSVDSQIANLRSETQTLQEQNDRYATFILTNRTPNVEHQLIPGPGYQNVTRIVSNDSYITVYFADGTSKTAVYPAI